MRLARTVSDYLRREPQYESTPLEKLKDYINRSDELPDLCQQLVNECIEKAGGLNPLSRGCGVSHGTLGKWRDKTMPPNIDLVKKLIRWNFLYDDNKQYDAYLDDLNDVITGG